jgi:hypothetical protein
MNFYSNFSLFAHLRFVTSRKEFSAWVLGQESVNSGPFVKIRMIVKVRIFFRGACITDVKYILDSSCESDVMIIFI